LTRFDLMVDGAPRSLEAGGGRCVSQGREAKTDVADLGAGNYSVVLDGNQYTVHLSPAGEAEYKASVAGFDLEIKVLDPRSLSGRRRDPSESGTHVVQAPMPGKVLAVHVSEGDSVSRDQGLVVVEAMKMQNELRSPKQGRVSAVRVKPGDSVAAGETLIVVD